MFEKMMVHNNPDIDLVSDKYKNFLTSMKGRNSVANLQKNTQSFTIPT